MSDGSCLEFWADYLHSARGVTNTVLVTGDGRQKATHALLLAGASQLLAEVLGSCGLLDSEVVVILPDFTVLQVEQLLQAIVTGGGGDSGQLGRELGVAGNKVVQESDSLDMQVDLGRNNDEDKEEEELAKALGLAEDIDYNIPSKDPEVEEKLNEEDEETELLFRRNYDKIPKGSKFSPFENRKRCLAAAKDISAGKFRSVRQAALYYNVGFSTLHKGLNSGGVFHCGRGTKSKVFTPKEERKLAKFIKSLDFQLNHMQLQRAIQDALLDVTKDRPERKMMMEDWVPGRSWVRRFVDRNGIAVARSKTITKYMENSQYKQ